MADGTHIEWCDATWNIVTGCSVVSPGCTNCYAMKLAGGRLKHHPSRAGLTQGSNAGPVWTGEVRFNEQWLDQPLRWLKPRRIFVSAHGDLFHENVPDARIDQVFAVMALAPRHTFQVLTKRAERMRDYLTPDRDVCSSDPSTLSERVMKAAEDLVGTMGTYERLQDLGDSDPSVFYPLPNVWLGVSVEDQARADERIPLLLDTPAAVRFISAEPLLGRVRFEKSWLPRIGHRLNPSPIHLVITGGESGPHARGACREWYRSIRDQCQAAGVAYFHKQNGEFIDADEWLDYVERGPSRRYFNGKPWHPTRPLNYADAAILAEFSGRNTFEHHSDGSTLIRVGKNTAGRLLDGRTWSEFPADG